MSTNTSSGTPTYQWERSDDGGVNYTNVVGANSASYTTPTLVFANDNSDRYRVVVSLVGAVSDITSTHGELTVLRVITIQTQPQNQGVIEGNTATFNIVASITSGAISYQWQKSINGGLDWTNIK